MPSRMAIPLRLINTARLSCYILLHLRALDSAVLVHLLSILSYYSL